MIKNKVFNSLLGALNWRMDFEKTQTDERRAREMGCANFWQRLLGEEVWGFVRRVGVCEEVCGFVKAYECAQGYGRFYIHMTEYISLWDSEKYKAGSIFEKKKHNRISQRNTTFWCRTGTRQVCVFIIFWCCIKLLEMIRMWSYLVGVIQYEYLWKHTLLQQSDSEQIQRLRILSTRLLIQMFDSKGMDLRKLIYVILLRISRSEVHRYMFSFTTFCIDVHYYDTNFISLFTNFSLFIDQLI